MSNGFGDWLSADEMKQLLALLIQLIKYLILANVGWSGLRLLPLLVQAAKLLVSEAWTWRGTGEAGLRRRWQTLSNEFSGIINQLLDLEKRKIMFLMNGVMKPFQALQGTLQSAARAIMA